MYGFLQGLNHQILREASSRTPSRDLCFDKDDLCAANRDQSEMTKAQAQQGAEYNETRKDLQEVRGHSEGKRPWTELLVNNQDATHKYLTQWERDYW